MNEVIFTIITIVVSTFVGYIFPFIVNAVKSIFKKKNKDKICGNWYMYFWWTKDGVVSRCDMTGEIKRNNIFKKDEKTEYNSLFSSLSKYFDRVLPNPVALAYKKDFQLLSFIRESVANRGLLCVY